MDRIINLINRSIKYYMCTGFQPALYKNLAYYMNYYDGAWIFK